jgi:flagellar basal-body rod modification protein FlgD
MTVTTNGATSTQNAAATPSSTVTGNGDISTMFTTLLVAQIQNQDPLNPTDSSQYVTQLAQLSQVQSLATLTAQGSANAALLQSLQAQSLGLQVGSQVTVSTNQLTLGGGAVSGDFTLSNPSTKTSMVLQSASGQKTSIAMGAEPAGDVSFTIDPAKLGLPAGTYSVSVSTSSGEAPSVNVIGTLNNVKISPSGGVLVDVSGVGQVASSAITAYDGYQTQSN